MRDAPKSESWSLKVAPHVDLGTDVHLIGAAGKFRSISGSAAVHHADAATCNGVKSAIVIAGIWITYWGDG